MANLATAMLVSYDCGTHIRATDLPACRNINRLVTFRPSCQAPKKLGAALVRKSKRPRWFVRARECQNRSGTETAAEQRSSSRPTWSSESKNLRTALPRYKSAISWYAPPSHLNMFALNSLASAATSICSGSHGLGRFRVSEPVLPSRYAVLAVGSRLVCSSCGSREIGTRPHWPDNIGVAARSGSIDGVVGDEQNNSAADIVS